MNGPTIWRCDAGSARRTSKPPRSTARGTISVSMASGPTASGYPGSSSGFQLMGTSHPAQMIGDGEDVLVAPAAQVEHHQVILRAFGGELDHLGERMGGFQRRDDAFELRAELKGVER